MPLDQRAKESREIAYEPNLEIARVGCIHICIVPSTDFCGKLPVWTEARPVHKDSGGQSARKVPIEMEATYVSRVNLG